MKTFHAKLSVAALALLLLATTPTWAQNKRAQKDTKKTTEKKEQVKSTAPEKNIPTVITCRVHREELEAQQDAGAVAEVGAAGRETETKNKRAEKQLLVFTYSEEGCTFDYIGVSGRILTEKPVMYISVVTDGVKRIAYKDISMLDMEFQTMYEEYLTLNEKGNDQAKRAFMQRYYKRTGKSRKIAGIDAAGYSMVYKGHTYEIYVDESRTVSGLCWPYLGMMHPVVGGTFLLPIQDPEYAAVEFEADPKGRASKRAAKNMTEESLGGAMMIDEWIIHNFTEF